MQTMKGQVLWFNGKLGYGFIKNKDINEDIFVHFTDIICDGYKTLYEDDIVEFLYDKENNKATEVRFIKKAFKNRKRNFANNNKGR